MRVGDVLEWLAASCFTTMAYLLGGPPAAFGAAGVLLAYLAQCYAAHRFPWLPGKKAASDQADSGS